MALIQCPECNTEVSEKARSCPKCGFPLKAGLVSNLQANIKHSQLTNKIICILLEIKATLNYRTKYDNQGILKEAITKFIPYIIITFFIAMATFVYADTHYRDYNELNYMLGLRHKSFRLARDYYYIYFLVMPTCIYLFHIIARKKTMMISIFISISGFLLGMFIASSMVGENYATFGTFFYCVLFALIFQYILYSKPEKLFKKIITVTSVSVIIPVFIVFLISLISDDTVGSILIFSAFQSIALITTNVYFLTSLIIDNELNDESIEKVAN